MVIKTKRKATEIKEEDHKINVKKPKPEENLQTTEGTTKNDNEFDVKHFRKEIKSKTGQNVPLVQFLQASSSNSKNYLKLYLDSGGSLNEILRQIDEGSKKNPIVVHPVFNLLHLLINEVQTSHPQLLQQTEETCRYLLSSYVSTIEYMLSEKCNSKQQRVTLQLLTVMVTLNVEIAFTILNQLSLQHKLLVHLAKRHPTPKEKDDVRAALILFLMSFFVDGNTTLIKALLDKQGLLTLVVPGLIHDKPETVLVVIEMLKKHIVHNPNISKTVKIRTFNQYLLTNLFNLFNWKSRKCGEGEETTHKSDIDESVFDLLLVLFTSHKHGIYFSDKHLATGDVLTNQHLCKALEGLDSPWNNDKAGQLVLTIVSLCPDLNKPVLHLVESSFQPRRSDQWTKTVSFLKTFYNSLPPKHVLSLMSEMSPTQVINFIRNVYLPVKILQTCHTTLTSPDLVLKCGIVSLLQVMLNAIKLFMQEMDSAGERFLKVKVLLEARVEEFIPKHFPSVDLLVSVMHTIIDDSKENPCTDPASDLSVPIVDHTASLISILDLLLIYNDVLPNSLDPIATMLDSKRLLERLEDLGGDSNGELKLKIIIFLLGADKFAFAPEKPLFKQILCSMLQVYTSTHSDMSLSSKSVLRQILKTTGIFDTNLSDIDILLSVFKICSSNNDIVEFVEIIMGMLESLPVDLQKVSSVCTKDMQKEVKLQHYVDIYFDNLETKHDNNCVTKFSLGKSSFSPFVFGILRHINKKGKSNEFANMCLLCLYHNQETPEYFVEILEEYNDIDASVKKYINNWLGKSVPLPSQVLGTQCVLRSLSKQLLCDAQPINMKDLLDVALGVDGAPENSLVVSSETFLYNPEFWAPLLVPCADLCVFYLTQQNNQNTLNTAKSHNCERVMQCLLSMSSAQSTPDENITKHLLEKCLAHNVMIEKFSPLGEDNVYLTEFLINIVGYCSQNNIQVKLVDGLLRPYRHKLQLALLERTKASEDAKEGVVLSGLARVLSVINLTLSGAQDVMREILKMHVGCLVTKQGDMSSWVPVVCHIMKLHIQNNLTLSHRIIQGVSALYHKLIIDVSVALNLQDLEDAVFSYLQKNPEAIALISHKVFQATFSVKHINKTTSKISALLLKNDAKLLQILKKHILKDDVLQKRELILPLMSAAFTHQTFAANLPVVKSVYEFYKATILKILEKPHKASQIYVENSDVIVKLINSCMDSNECEKFTLKTLKFDVLVPFHIDMIEEVYFKAYFSTKQTTHMSGLLLCVIQLANVGFKKDDVSIEKLSRVADTIRNVLLIAHSECYTFEHFSTLHDNSAVLNFFKSVLKYYLRTEHASGGDLDCSLFSMMSSVIAAVYPNNHEVTGEMFDMATSHSEFLNIMLSNRCMSVKTALAKLLLVLVSHNNQLAKPSHIPVYLSSYRATMSQSDRYLLCLLNIYERAGLSVNQYQPYFWGDIAANHFAVKSKRTNSSLWSNSTANQVLNLLDKEMIEKTIKQFQIEDKLNVEETITKDINYLFGINPSEMKSIQDDVFNKIYVKRQTGWCSSKDVCVDVVKCKLVMEKGADTRTTWSPCTVEPVYDPAFIIPLLNFVVCPGSTVSCHRIIRNGVLSIPLMALSSHCCLMRAASFNVLQRFYNLLESEMYYKNDKILWTQFIDTLKGSLTSMTAVGEGGVPRLPTVGALYLARSALVMTHPLDVMFKPVNNFVISKQCIDLKVIPDFLQLFHNTDITFMERRTWMLKLLRDGVKSLQDVDVILKSVAFKIMLDFYSCSLCDVKQKCLILEIINACVQIPKVAKLLIEGYSLFSWLSNTFRGLNSDNKKLISLSVNLVSNLWLSISLESNKHLFKRMIEDNNGAAFVDLLYGKSFKLNQAVQSNIIHLLSQLSHKLCLCPAEDITAYLSILNKIPVSKYEKHIDTRSIRKQLNSKFM